MKLLGKWFISALGLLLAAYLVPSISVASFVVALLVALVLGFVNIFLKPILLILTLPINILTLGLFTFVVNGLLFWFVASFVDGFEITATGWHGLGVAMLGALIVSVCSYAGNHLLFSDRD
jgi:putative membrane protein